MGQSEVELIEKTEKLSWQKATHARLVQTLRRKLLIALGSLQRGLQFCVRCTTQRVTHGKQLTCKTRSADTQITHNQLLN